MDIFRCTEIIGDHRVYSSSDSGILDYLKRLWGVIDLEKLHLHSNDFRSLSPHQLSEVDSDKHTAFYDSIKSDESFLVNHYIPLVRKIHAAFFPSETELIYQTYPTIRIQYPDGTAIPKHRDSDELSKHPFGENNFIIPLTRMFDTCSMYIESSPDKEDFSPMTLQYGQLLWFNGNMCTPCKIFARLTVGPRLDRTCAGSADAGRGGVRLPFRRRCCSFRPHADCGRLDESPRLPSRGTFKTPADGFKECPCCR